MPDGGAEPNFFKHSEKRAHAGASDAVEQFFKGREIGFRNHALVLQEALLP